MTIKIEAATRLAAQELYKQLIGDSAGNQHCKAYAMQLRKNPDAFTSLGTKDGIEMGVFRTPPFQTILMRKDDQVVAYLELIKATDSSNGTAYKLLKGKYFVVAELFIRKEYRGIKLGTVLHLGAAHAFKHLASDINMAVAALASFRSLAKYGYKISLINSSAKTFPDFKWGPNGIPEINGKSIEDLKDVFVLYTK